MGCQLVAKFAVVFNRLSGEHELTVASNPGGIRPGPSIRDAFGL